MKGVGLVKVLNSRDVRGRKGMTSVWSMKVEHDDGEESPWITVKFGPKPRFDKGDYIEYEAEQNDKGYWNVTDEGASARIVNPPSKAVAGQTASTYNSQVPVASSAGADRQRSIVLQHSQEMAIRLIAVMLEHDALPVSATTTKAGKAKRYNEVRAYVNKLTVSLYNDATTDRLLESVEDEGVIDVSAESQLPGAGTVEAEGEDD